VFDRHDPVIAARGLRVSYGSLPVLFGVDLAVERGKGLARGRVVLSGQTSDLSGELAELEAALLGTSA
jgi:hypothetical protein